MEKERSRCGACALLCTRWLHWHACKHMLHIQGCLVSEMHAHTLGLVGVHVASVVGGHVRMNVCSVHAMAVSMQSPRCITTACMIYRTWW